MCCLFGLLDCGHRFTGKQKSQMIAALSVASEARGTDASGIAYTVNGNLHIYKRPVAAHRLKFRIPDAAFAVMGHTRMATQGSEKHNFNNHPFRGKAGGCEYALAHNGVLWNDRLLREQKSLPKTHIQTDSYIAVQLIDKQKALDFSSLKIMAETVRGSFTFTLLNQRNDLYVVKGDNPFCLIYFPKEKLYLYASTQAVMEQALSQIRTSLGDCEQVKLDYGDILRIDRNGKRSSSYFEGDGGFDYWGGYSCGYCAYPYHANKPSGWAQSYREELQTIAASLGFPAEYIDWALGMGCTPDEVEEMLYEERDAQDYYGLAPVGRLSSWDAYEL